MGNLERFETCKRRKCIFFILHILCCIGPIIGFGIYGWMNSEVQSKVVFTTTTVAAIIMALITLVTQDIRTKSKLQKTITWILVIGLIYMLNDLKPFIWILALSSVFDELLFNPMYVRYSELVRTNREIYLNNSK